jgi:Flp pilus assembly protein TadD
VEQERPPVAPPGAAQPDAAQPDAAQPDAVHAYSGLLGKARAASAQGDYDGAIALLERAQRIDPDSAELYLELARTYMAQGRTDQARATASRGTLYCRSAAECAALRELAR